MPATTLLLEGIAALRPGQQPGSLQIHLQVDPKRNRLQPGHGSKVSPQRGSRSVESTHLIASIVKTRKVRRRRRQPRGKIMTLGKVDPPDLRFHLGPELQFFVQKTQGNPTSIRARANASGGPSPKPFHTASRARRSRDTRISSMTRIDSAKSTWKAFKMESEVMNRGISSSRKYGWKHWRKLCWPRKNPSRWRSSCSAELDRIVPAFDGKSQAPANGAVQNEQLPRGSPAGHRNQFHFCEPGLSSLRKAAPGWDGRS